MSGPPCGQVLSGRGYRSREKGQPVDLGPASKLSCSGGSRRRSSQQPAGREFGRRRADLAWLFFFHRVGESNRYSHLAVAGG
jgi:hypothetical protein